MPTRKASATYQQCAPARGVAELVDDLLAVDCVRCGRSRRRPISRPRSAFCSDSWKVRPIAITSPTDFICVVRRSSACGNFSKAKRGILVTT